MFLALQNHSNMINYGQFQYQRINFYWHNLMLLDICCVAACSVAEPDICVGTGTRGAPGGRQHRRQLPGTQSPSWLLVDCS